MKPAGKEAVTPVVELLRVSTESQAEGLNLEAQASVNEAACARHGLRKIATIRIVESGSTVANSPEMQRVLSFIASGKAKGIVTSEFSRLFRPDNFDDYQILQRIREHGACIYLPTETIDLRTDAGFMTTSMYTMIAGMERGRIISRMKAGKEEHRRRGEPAGGNHMLPFGITYDKGWKYTDDIAKVREIFRLFLSGEDRNYARIARRVGVTRRQVEVVLQNPTYTGERIYDRCTDMSPDAVLPGSTREKVRRRLTKRDPEQVIRVKLPLEPILSKEDFARVEALRADRKIQNPRRPATAIGVYRYRPYAICPDCNVPYYTKTGSVAKKPYYTCKNRNAQFRKPGVRRCTVKLQDSLKLDPIIDRAISDALLNPTVVRKAVATYNARIAQDWQQLRPLVVDVQERRRVLEGKRKRVVNAFIEGDIEASEKRERLAVIDAEIETLEKLPTEGERSKPFELEVQNLGLMLDQFQRWEFQQSAHKLRVLAQLYPIIVVRDYKVEGIALPLGDLAGPGGEIKPGSRSRWNLAPWENIKNNNAFLYFDLAA